MTKQDKGERFALLEQVGTSIQAHILISVLKDAGIPVRTSGENLVDEFAMSHKLMGDAVRVEVPESRLEEARWALEEARAQGRAAFEEDGEEDPPGSR